MCSVSDFIDKQKYIIQSQQKTIQTLYKFLGSIDKPNDEKTETNGDKKQFETKTKPKTSKSYGESNGNYVSNQKIGKTNDLMNARNGLLGWIDSEKGQQKRHELAEERRREYNEFIQKKSEPNSQNSIISSKRITKLIPEYHDILKDKRIEEQRHRQLNAFDDINDIEDLNDVMFYKNKRRTFVPQLPTIGWGFYCSNNKFDPQYITPRSRLLATHSSRVRAAKYSEELRKQVEEKERIKAEEKQRNRTEEEELERKLTAQRLKLLQEFEEEHRLLKKKAQQNRTKDEVNKQLSNRDLMIGSAMSASPLSLLRSPTYMHMKETQPLSPARKKSSAVSRSLASALSQTIPTSQSMATQTSNEQKHITSEEESDFESSISSNEEENIEEEEQEEDAKNSKEFRRRVLSQLSEVRQMMESDHIKMMEQLRHQQLSQLDE